jgi:hypothetical protein
MTVAAAIGFPCCNPCCYCVLYCRVLLHQSHKWCGDEQLRPHASNSDLHSIPGPAGRHSVWRFAVEIKASSPSHVQRVNDRLIPCMWSSIDTLCGSYFFFGHSPSFTHAYLMNYKWSTLLVYLHQHLQQFLRALARPSQMLPKQHWSPWQQRSHVARDSFFFNLLKKVLTAQYDLEFGPRYFGPAMARFSVIWTLQSVSF